MIGNRLGHFRIVEKRRWEAGFDWIGEREVARVDLGGGAE